MSTDNPPENEIDHQEPKTADPIVEQNIWLCAEKGWAATFFRHDGETIVRAFITATDESNKAFVVEKPGERDRPPRIMYVHEIKKVEPHWS